MTQADNWQVGSNPSGLLMRQAVNKNVEALATLHKGSTPPDYAEDAGFQWLDDSDDPVWTLRVFKGGTVSDLANWGAVWSYNRTTGNYTQAGNVGIGSTPPDGWEAYNVITLGGPTQFIGGSAGTTLPLGINAYYDGTTYRRVQAVTAVKIYTTDSDGFYWDHAAAGAADSAISLTRIASLSPNAFNGGLFRLLDSAGNVAVNLDANGDAVFKGTRVLIGGDSYSPLNAKIQINYAGGGSQYGMTFRPDSNSTTAIEFANASGGDIGNINCSASATSYNTTSDQRLKFNIEPAPSQLDWLRSVNVVEHEFRNEPGPKHIGVLAQAHAAISPQAISQGDEGEAWEDEDGNFFVTRTWGVDPSKDVYRLAKALQEVLAYAEALEVRVAALEAA